MAELSTNQKGLIAESAIIHEAIRLGIGVARPLDDERYDLILDLGERLLKVQCKWASRQRGVLIVGCRSTRRGRNGFVIRSYEPGEIDAIAAYSDEFRTCYLLPPELSFGRSFISLRVAPTKNNQSERVNWAKDYEFGAKLFGLPGP